ncbi:MAG: beta-glucosidase, partial [Candidatus Sumerlaeia bacterium]|nr:beta-glucosidase [Candidatus Sumerlaeia bacterium]
MTNRWQFPEYFKWGVSASSYQIEGTPMNGEVPASNWDKFCARPGTVRDGVSGRIACDHQRHFEEDLDLLESFGIEHYRLSISWPRILPDGRGAVNDQGIDFYDRLIDAALKRNIKPSVTCFHWDMPQVLESKGGWLSRETAEAFADFCGILGKRFGDRVQTWYTLNEPNVVWRFGHEHGHHAPGRKLRDGALYQVMHHMLLAHGLGLAALRATTPSFARIGIAENLYSYEPAQPSREDVNAAKETFHRMNRWFLDPLFHGHYPEEEWDQLEDAVPKVLPGDMDIISIPMSFFGLNHYSPMGVVSAAGGVRPFEDWHPRTDFGWPIRQESIYWTLRFFHEIYRPVSIEITENGCCFPDQIGADGEIHDNARIAFLAGALEAVSRAYQEGVPVTAYYLWSLMDNFEWAEGYTKRFGIIHVNWETLKRTPKASAHWYSSFILN